MHVNLMGYVWFQEKKGNALMFTKLGSKSVAANNYRINEDPETMTTAIVANTCMLIP